MVRALFEATGGVVRVVGEDGGRGAAFDYAIFITGDEGVATLRGLRSGRAAEALPRAGDRLDAGQRRIPHDAVVQVPPRRA